MKVDLQWDEKVSREEAKERVRLKRAIREANPEFPIPVTISILKNQFERLPTAVLRQIHDQVTKGGSGE